MNGGAHFGRLSFVDLFEIPEADVAIEAAGDELFAFVIEAKEFDRAPVTMNKVACLLTCLLAYLLTCSLAYLLTCLLAYLLT